MAYERLVRKLTVENLWLYVLILLREEPRYGYEIRKAILERFGFEPDIVTAYAVLLSLRRAGYISVKELRRSPEGPKRKYYTITPKGEQALAQAKQFINGLRIKLFGS